MPGPVELQGNAAGNGYRLLLGYVNGLVSGNEHVVDVDDCRVLREDGEMDASGVCIEISYIESHRGFTGVEEPG